MNKSFIIPENAKITNIKIQENIITVDYELIEPTNEFIPKDGDFCTSSYNGYECLFIFKREENGHLYHACLDSSNELDCNSLFAHIVEITPATESEKQTLLSEIDKAGFLWNAEKKRIEKKKWRAEIDEKYYIIDPSMGECKCNDEGREHDNNRFKHGNYFQTSKQTTEAANLIEELLFHFHEDDEV